MSSFSRDRLEEMLEDEVAENAKLLAECDALRAENERLRAVLEALAQRHHRHDNGACLRNPAMDLSPCQVAEIAREKEGKS